jgi:ABC-type multidrug transport system ATPase subunit
MSCKAERNEIFGLLGQNGCGKTTSLSMLTAQLRPTSGSIHLGDWHVASQKYQVISNIGLNHLKQVIAPSLTTFCHRECP